MKNIPILFLFAFTMCNSNNNYTPVKATSQFEGRFKANQAGVSATADFTVQDNQINGTIVMNGKSAIVNGAISGTSVAGKITEEGKEFEFTGSVSGNQLRLTITNPDQVSQKSDLVFERESLPSSPLPNPVDGDAGDKERNEALVGLWKGTEILGTGEFAMTNETMIEFLEDGSFLMWPGRSVGPDYQRDEDKSQTSKGTWYTNGESLHLVKPANGQDAKTNYSVSESGLLMSDGGSQKKSFVRVR